MLPVPQVFTMQLYPDCRHQKGKSLRPSASPRTCSTNLGATSIAPANYGKRVPLCNITLRLSLSLSLSRSRSHARTRTRTHMQQTITMRIQPNRKMKKAVNWWQRCTITFSIATSGSGPRLQQSLARGLRSRLSDFSDCLRFGHRCRLHISTGAFPAAQDTKTAFGLSV